MLYLTLEYKILLNKTNNSENKLISEIVQVNYECCISINNNFQSMALSLEKKLFM